MPPASRLPRGECHGDANEQQNRRQAPAIEAALPVAFIRTAERGERWYPPYPEERDRGEQERDQHTHRHTEDRRGPRHLRVHVHRKKAREQSREGPLRYEAAGRPDDAAGKAHRRCLERVHDKHQSCAGAETAKHGHRLPSLANEDDDGARHADPAQEQCDQRHEPEISG